MTVRADLKVAKEYIAMPASLQEGRAAVLKQQAVQPKLGEEDGR